MKIIEKITLKELQAMTGEYYDDMIKGVVDVRNGILALNAALHSEIKSFLLDGGSAQEDLWGINIFPFLEGEDFIVYESLINIRPAQNNRSNIVQDGNLKKQIAKIVHSKII